MKLINFGYVTRIRLVDTDRGLELRTFSQEHRVLKAPYDYTTMIKDQWIVINNIDPIVPCRIIIKNKVLDIVPMGYFDMGKSPKSFLMEVKKYPDDKIFLKIKPNLAEGKSTYDADALILQWFNYALKMFNYIPVVIFDHLSNKIMFQGDLFEGIEDLKEHWKKQIENPVFKVILEGFGFDTSSDSYQTINIKELLDSFVKYVEHTEKEVLKKNHYEWLVSNWSIPVKLFKEEINQRYPKVEDKEVEK